MVTRHGPHLDECEEMGSDGGNVAFSQGGSHMHMDSPSLPPLRNSFYSEDEWIDKAFRHLTERKMGLTLLRALNVCVKREGKVIVKQDSGKGIHVAVEVGSLLHFHYVDPKTCHVVDFSLLEAVGEEMWDCYSSNQSMCRKPRRHFSDS
jgi:hypothetical protein